MPTRHSHESSQHRLGDHPRLCLACLALIHADMAVSAHYYRFGSGFYLDSAWWCRLCIAEFFGW